MRSIICVIITTGCLMSGCKMTNPPPLDLVILPDISASIDPASRHQMFAAIEKVAARLQRGDRLTIVPITGDAEAELSGQILHYELPDEERRQAYDADLRKIAVEITNDLNRLSVQADANPGRYSDIVGTIQVASAQFANHTADQELVVLSDFIQESQGVNFRKVNPLNPVQFNQELADIRRRIDAGTVKLDLGRVSSREFADLPLPQRRAIDSFWSRAFPHASLNPDGIAMVEKLAAIR